MKKFFGVTLSATVLALWSVTAPASLENIENAYESDVAHIMLPTSSTGRVILRECSNCKPVVMNVSADTVYLVGSANPPVSLAELRAAANADGGGSRLMTVFYNLKTGVITRIILSAG
jgi:hypothetical protein